MEYSDLFKIGGLAGVALFFFYVIVKAIVRHPTRTQYLILVMAFILSFFALYIFYKMQFKEDGGLQPSSALFEIKRSVSFASLKPGKPQDCRGLKAGEFELWLSFNSDKPYFLMHDDKTRLRVALVALTDGKASFQVWAQDQMITQTQIPMDQNQLLTFEWQGCSCKLTYLGEGKFKEGFRFLNRERKTARYKLEVK